MEKLEYFEIVDDRGEFRPAGEITLEAAGALVTRSIKHARGLKLRKLLVVLTGLTGFNPPSLGGRYFLIQEWARAAGGSVSMAGVLRPELIDPQEFGATVARNMGVKFRPFSTEAQALQWLESLPGEESPPITAAK